MMNQTLNRQSARFEEIDALRGFAIILMVFYHLLVDLRDFYGYAIAYNELPWIVVGRTSAILFITISGLSCSLSSGNIKRGLRVFLFGMVVTAATFIFVRELYIRFGILHFLGSSMVIWGMIDRLVRSDKVKLVLLSVCAPGFLLLGALFGRMRTGNPYLFFLGLITPDFATYDYYPLLPWLGLFLAGVTIGTVVYKNRRKSLPGAGLAGKPEPAGFILRGIMALGRNSLVIYILHQPILLSLLFLLDRLRCL